MTVDHDFYTTRFYSLNGERINNKKRYLSSAYFFAKLSKTAFDLRALWIFGKKDVELL